ncbi:sugar kinase [candidate division KSB1 bacterium]|nr:MAG: sugar kinase [candidate division KSB1 bacterium]
MSSVLVVGSMAYDSIETPKGKVEDTLGGSATYFSAAASLLTPVNVVAVVGEDFRHDELNFLRIRKVNFDGLQQEKGKTFRWGGRYSEDFNERETLYTQLNVFQDFSPQIPPAYKTTPYVFLANIGPQLQQQVLQQMATPLFTAMDTMNFWISGNYESLLEVIGQVDCLMLNDSEARQLVDESNLVKALQKIAALGPEVVIVKKGEHGAVMRTQKGLFFAPAFPISEVVDCTGAGDSFAGGFMGYLASTDDLSENNLRKAMVFGSIVASFCVEDFGIRRLQSLTLAEIQERYRQFRQLTSVE